MYKEIEITQAKNLPTEKPTSILQCGERLNIIIKSLRLKCHFRVTANQESQVLLYMETISGQFPKLLIITSGNNEI